MSFMLGLVSANVPSYLSSQCECPSSSPSTLSEGVESPCCSVENECCHSKESDPLRESQCLCSDDAPFELLGLTELTVKDPVLFFTREITFTYASPVFANQLNDADEVKRPPPESIIKRYCVYLI